MKEHFQIRDQMHPMENIDRARRHSANRISCGLRVDDKFECVSGMLVVSIGCGKWMRPSVFRTVSVQLPEAVRQLGLRVVQSEGISVAELKMFAADLASVQALAVNHLLSGSVKVLDNVLAVSVEDHGFWFADFDGKLNYHSLCDPCRLAELTGISVIDALPSNDIAAGGNGTTLSPLPNWILFADRNAKISTVTRLLIQVDANIGLTLLPPSDGLDAELPAIHHTEIPGLNLINTVARRLKRSETAADESGKIAVQGKFREEIMSVLKESYDRDPAIDADTSQQNSLEKIAALKIGGVAEREGIRIHDVLCTVNHFLAMMITSHLQKMDRRLSRTGATSIGELVLAGPGARNGFLQQLINSSLASANQPNVRSKKLVTSEEFNIDPRDVSLLVTSVLGLMHIDQMPATIPALTGAEYPRLLGRLTPGRPANWRRLLMEMADYRPPAMKLRAAV